jgi:hypothetical protein
MKTRTPLFLLPLLICLSLVACQPSQAGLDTTTTQKSLNTSASQTAQAPLTTLTFIPGPIATSTPTMVPSPTSTYTPVPTSTITPTPTLPVIGVQNAAQVTLLDTLTDIVGVDGIIFSPGEVATLRLMNDNTLQKDILQLHVPLPDFGPTPWAFASPAFSSDGKMVVSQTQDENGYALTIWEVREDLRLIPLAQNFSGYTLNGFNSGFSNDGKYIFSVSIPQRITIVPDDWQRCAPNCRFTFTYKPISNGVYQMPVGNRVSELEITTAEANYYRNMFYPDNSYLATIYSKYDSNQILWINVQLWQVSDGTQYRKLDSIQLDENKGESANLAFSPTGEDLAFTGDRKLQVWQWEPNTFRWTVDGNFSALAYSPDGSLIATGAPDGSIRLWRASDGVELATLSAKDHPISYVAFSPNGSLLVTLDASGMLMLWSIQTN